MTFLKTCGERRITENFVILPHKIQNNNAMVPIGTMALHTRHHPRCSKHRLKIH